MDGDKPSESMALGAGFVKHSQEVSSGENQNTVIKVCIIELNAFSPNPNN